MSSIGVQEGRMSRELHAYHDGELNVLARWRFERRLARSPELRRELDVLVTIGEAVREVDGATQAPDLWASIAAQLPAADASRGETQGSFSEWLAPMLRPAAAVVATAGIALAVAIGLTSGDTAAVGVVSWMDSGGRNVIVLDGESGATIIWVLDDAPAGASRGGPRVAV